MKRIPCEQDLKSSNATAYGWAAAQCQNPSQDCLADGFCHYEGHCFERKGWTHDEALEHIEVLSKQLDGMTVKFNQLKAFHLHVKQSLNFMIKQSVNEGKDEQVFAYRRCLKILERVEV